MTRWPKFLHGHSFYDVALLASPANPASEPLLAKFSDSLDRIVEEAHSSIRKDKVDVFDQARINSFIQRRRAFDRPLLTKLRDATYRNYKQVLKRLICFAYRTIQPKNRVVLAHHLTASQLKMPPDSSGSIKNPKVHRIRRFETVSCFISGPKTLGNSTDQARFLGSTPTLTWVDI